MRDKKPDAERERGRQLRNDKMPAPLARAIGTPAEDKHSDEARHKGNRSDPADALNIGPTGEALEHRGKPKPKGIAAGVSEEQPSREH